MIACAYPPFPHPRPSSLVLLNSRTSPHLTSTPPFQHPFACFAPRLVERNPSRAYRHLYSITTRLYTSERPATPTSL